MSKPRAAYTPTEDVVVMKEVVRHINSEDGGSSGGGRALLSKHEWAAIAGRVALQGIELTGDALRRRVGELVKKLKRDEENEAAGKPRMRWGMAWPKTEEEQERDRLIGEYNKLQEQAKQKPSKEQLPKNTEKVQSTRPVDLIPTYSTPAVSLPVAKTSKSSTSIRSMTSSPLKRKHPPTAAVVEIEDDSLDVEYSYESDHQPSQYRPRQLTRSGDAKESERQELKRRRLEMDERVQNRMLDIQAEQIALQREQLRFQAESLRAMAEATQAIARVLHAFPKRS